MKMGEDGALHFAPNIARTHFFLGYLNATNMLNKGIYPIQLETLPDREISPDREKSPDQVVFLTAIAEYRNVDMGRPNYNIIFSGVLHLEYA